MFMYSSKIYESNSKPFQNSIDQKKSNESGISKEASLPEFENKNRLKTKNWLMGIKEKIVESRLFFNIYFL